MAKSRIYPQFFHTLASGFHKQLTIPEDFFSKYIEGRRSVAEIKSDISDKTWKVKMSARSLTGGSWKEFALAHDLQIGDVVVVRYVGDMVFHVSDLGPNYSEIQDYKGCFSDTEIPRKKKAKNIQEAEADVVSSSSSSSDNSCFVALVTASNLRSDTLYLPLHFTRKCREIVLTDGGERSWLLDLRFNESSYISRGWRNFCDENGQKAGGFFMFQLVRNEETPVLSFSPTESTSDRRPTESTSDRRQRDCSEASKRESVATKHSSKEENIAGEGSEDECSSPESLTEKKKDASERKFSSYSSYSSRHKRFITFTLPPDYIRLEKLCLPKPFLRENDIKPGEMYLLGKDGKKWLTKLILDNKGTMKMRKGWKDFVKENNLKSSFTLKLIWEDTTPVLSLSDAEPTSDREKEDSSPSSQKQFVTLTITSSGIKKCRLQLPSQFMKANGINRLGKVSLLSDNGMEWSGYLLSRDGTVSLGCGWEGYCEANGVKLGQSFTLEFSYVEDTTPVLKFCSQTLNTKMINYECNKNTFKGMYVQPNKKIWLIEF
ncbi:PREDICTED: B3 domain-containing protein REM13-like isoform X2 [Camelina sativa]|uniref:B3 domain-containing protein REM13-like isoform X2 n=1 Tax=Camelina sativa TaxID=90675 RepID=A0ABM1Q9P7_CAMSA|nr:PREDICTED: B3 domain-containing protein REM13-like isoform X2 [Camelina sativa]